MKAAGQKDGHQYTYLKSPYLVWPSFVQTIHTCTLATHSNFVPKVDPDKMKRKMEEWNLDRAQPIYGAATKMTTMTTTDGYGMQ